jgi:hypothetical protein
MANLANFYWINVSQQLNLWKSGKTYTFANNNLTKCNQTIFAKLNCTETIRLDATKQNELLDCWKTRMEKRANRQNINHTWRAACLKYGFRAYRTISTILRLLLAHLHRAAENEAIVQKNEDTCWVEIDHSKIWLWLFERNQCCPTRSLYRTHLAAFQNVAGSSCWALATK